MKRKVICSLVYFFIIFMIGAIATHNEYLTTALIINLWFSIPMSISYYVELFIFKKASNVLYVIIAIVNTIILFIILCALGIYILGKYMYIPF